MTEEEIASSLVESFRQQARLFSEIQSLNKDYQAHLAARKSAQELLPLLKSKKERVDRITQLDARVSRAKEERKARKAEWQRDDLKKQIQDSLTRVSQQAAEVVETERRLAGLQPS